MDRRLSYLHVVVFLTVLIAMLFTRSAVAADAGYVAAGHFPCAITRGGDLVCWFNTVLSIGVSGKFISLVRDPSNGTALLRPDGTVVGVTVHESGYGQIAALANSGFKYKSLALGNEATRACGVTIDGKLNCYGNDGADPGQPIVSPGGSVSGPNASIETYTQVSMGRYTTCAVTTTGHIRCWGRTSYEITGPNSDPDLYTYVSNSDVTCGLRTDGRLKCWGAFPGAAQAHVNGPNASTDTFTAVSLGFGSTCGLKTDGHVQCWFVNAFADFYGAHAQTNASTETFGAFSTGFSETNCGITLTGQARCFGNNFFGVVSAANSLTQRFAISPPDFISPLVALLGPNPMSIPYKATFVDPGATAFDVGDGDLTGQIVASGAVNVAVAGTYTRTYAVSDLAGNIGTATRTVIVLPDTTPPVITLLGPDPLTISGGSPFPAGTATALDSQDGDVTSRIVVSGYNAFQVGAQIITYTVTDLSGNRATAQRTINVVDTTPPVFSFFPPAVITRDSLGPAGTPVFWSFRATDTFDPAPRASCTPPPNFKFPDGDTTVVCTATDFSGNTTTRSFRVHIRGAAEQIAILRNLVVAAQLDPSLTQDLLKWLDDAATNVANKPAKAVKDLDQFMRGVVKAYLAAPQGVNANQAFQFVFRSNRIEVALGVALPADAINNAELQLISMRSDMEYYGVADVDHKLTHSLQGAMLALADDKKDQAVHFLQKFIADFVTVPVDPYISEYFIGYAEWIESILGFANANPNAAYVESILPYAVDAVRNAGLDRGLTTDLLAKLAQAGKQIAKGSTKDGCDSIGRVITILQNEQTSGRITADQADAILGWLNYFRDLLAC